MTFGILLVGISLLLLIEIALNHRQLVRAVTRAHVHHKPQSTLPSITVVRPVRGADVGAAENYAAHLNNGYPGDIETLFVFDDADDPGYPIACDAVRRHLAAGGHGRAEVLIAGPPPAGVTGKLHAMMLGEARARGELVAFGDSDTRPDRQVLRATVETLMAMPDAGCAFAPVVVANRAERAGDAGYATLINAWYGPSVALASERTGDVPFIMGQLMVFRRGALNAIGGVGCARGQLVDDMYIGARVFEAGWRNVMAPHPLDINTGGMGVRAFLLLFNRWILFSRNGLPIGFTWPMWVRCFEFWIGVGALVLALRHHQPLLGLLPLGALVAYNVSVYRLGRVFGGPPVKPHHWIVPALLPVIGPAEAAFSLWHKQVTWRGRAYRLDTQARLA